MGFEISNYPYVKQDSLYNAYMHKFASSNVNNVSTQCGYYNIQNTVPNFKGILATQPDTVSFSASSQLQPPKEGMSTFAKVGLGLLGIGVTTYACVVGHRMKTKPTIDVVTKNLSEIFRKDVSKKEATKMAEKYKEIFKEDNVDEFCTKMFNQVKKDYGYEDSDIKLVIDKITDVSRKDECGGGWLLSKSRMYLRPNLIGKNKFDKANKISTFKTLIHEFQHVKQSELAYRTDAKKYVDIMQDNCGVPKDKAKLKEELEHLREILKNENRLVSWAKERDQSVEELKADIRKALDKNDFSGFMHFSKDDCQKNFDNLFGKFTKLEKGSEDYKKGLKYLDNEANYIDYYDDKDGYYKQILEAEAYDAEKKIKSLLGFIENPWRII